MDPHDPLARVLFLLLRDHLPVGEVERAIERTRLILREVPDSPSGAVALDLAERIRRLAG